jgi:hypothetical protein
MVHAKSNEWSVLKDNFVASRQDEANESIETFLDEEIRRRFGEYIMRAVLPEYRNRTLLPRRNAK